MLRRHATPNTSSTATTGITRLFGVQYWIPSITPTTAVVIPPNTRLNRSRGSEDPPRTAVPRGRAGAVIRPIAGPVRVEGGACRSWFDRCPWQRQQPGDRVDVLRERHPSGRVRQ